MAIKFKCECGKEFRAKDEYAGRRAVCPQCKREFLIQLPELRQQEVAIAPVKQAAFRTIEPAGIEIRPEGRADVGRPFWKDPIVVIGAAIPFMILTFFLRYLAWPYVQSFSNRSRPQVHQVAHAEEPSIADTIPSYDPERPRRNPKIPIEVSYPIMEDERHPPAMRVVRVALNMKVAKEVLREIAFEVKSKEIDQYQRTLVYFVLSEYWKEKFSWATARFDSTFEINIDGLEEGNDELLAAQDITLPTDSTLIGSWISQEFGWRTTIYALGGKYYMIRLFPSDALNKPSRKISHDHELINRSSADGLTFEVNIYTYRVEPWGGLTILDKNRMLSICKPADDYTKGRPPASK